LLSGPCSPNRNGIVGVGLQRLKLGDPNQSFWKAHDDFKVAPHRLNVAPQRAEVEVGAVLDLRDLRLRDAQAVGQRLL
jgi:hypothetical protein